MSVDTPSPAPDAQHPTRPAARKAGGGLRPWLVWGVGVGAYFMAMLHRNSLGVAALAAQERFDVGPALLSTLPMLQLLVYVALQVPSGVLADRLGPRRTLLIGLVSMTVGVGMFALAPTIHVALLGRLCIGLGDALTFLNVIRLVALWFPRSQYALVSALTGVMGGLGQLASVAPLSAALRAMGWAPAFLAAGGVTALMIGLVALVVRDRPAGSAPPPAEASLSVLASIREALRAPGPRAGMAHHAAAMGPYTMLTVLWGYPFLVEGMGMSPDTATLLLTGLGLATLWISPALGAVVGRYPGVRRPFATVFVTVFSLGWLALVAWPGGPPVPFVVAVLVASATGGVITPALSLDFARDGIPAHRTGVASALVNVAGFTTTVFATVSAGVILELLPEPHGGADFQLAFVPLAVMTAFAAVTLLVVLRRYPSRR
ncbi:MFS transporter [Salinactinospora qingdaonensis]|uniref:MFS transporter n=1 Tax=Salinactinospora qingdaonensis TaxID=702744 RepID=A0ABP7F3H3_9ACTN